MSITLAGVKCIGLSITPDLTIPLLKVVVKDVDNPTENEMKSLLSAVYNQSSGAVTVAAYYGLDEYVLPIIQDIPNGETTYGIAPLFQFTVKKDRDYPNYPLEYALKFRNKLVAEWKAFTGYADYETSFGCIFVDEQNNIYEVNGWTCFNELYGEYKGIQVYQGVCTVAAVIGSHSVYLPNGVTRLSNENRLGGIGDYIKREYDPADNDPFVDGEGDASGTGGGMGDFNGSSDTIALPDLPSVSAINTGFITLFVPTAAQLRNLSAYLWTDLLQDVASGGSLDTIVSDMKKIIANPYDALLGLSIVPVAIPTGGSKEVKMYGAIQSGISMPYASTQYVSIDCGTLNINEYWGAYLDYSPYTKVTSLYLPYVGIVTVDVDEIMNKALRVVYHIDVLSGQCIAYIVINGSVEYQYQGHCACTIPITSADFSGSISSGLNILGSLSNVTSAAAGGFAMGGGIGAALGAAAGVASVAPSVAGNVMNMKPDIKSGGAIGGMGGMLSVQKPFLIAIRPRQSAPEYQNSLTGYPSNITMTVGQCSGYTEFDVINLDNVSLTSDEKEELERILKQGVYL